MVELDSPYTEADAGTWLRGNVHTHTTESDGDLSVEAVVDAYEDRGYDFLAVSDHDVLVDPATYRDRTSMVLVPAVEVTADGPHLLHVGATRAIDPDPDRGAVLDAVGADEGFAVANHPNWEADFDHWPQSLLSDLDGFRGIEVYNGVIERHPGSPVATDRWDRLLAAGRRLWGYGTDDFHATTDFENGWTVVRTDARTPEAVFRALHDGRCYASTGVVVDTIAVERGRLSVATGNAATIRLLSDHGVVQRTVDGPDATFEVPDDLRYGADHTYVRIECIGDGGAMAWLQPAFLRNDG